MEQLTPEFKRAFNKVIDEINSIRDGRGNFHLCKEIDFGLHPLVEKIKDCFDVNKSTQ